MKKNENKIEYREEKVKYMIKDLEVEVIEKYYIDLDTNERVYNRNLSIENDIAAYDVYKKMKRTINGK